MAAIPVSISSVDALKKVLRRDFVEEKLSHLAEALGAALGFRTYAALLKAAESNRSDPPYAVLSTERFITRLETLGYPRDNEFDFEWLVRKGGPLTSTLPITAFDVNYKSVRERAWRNLMVYAINEGIREKLFSLRPGDNRWPGSISGTAEARDMRGGHRGHIFDFSLPNGTLARGYVDDAGWSELSIHVAVQPKGDWLRVGNAGFYAGEAFACSWLERERGAWLQSATTLFTCRKSLLKQLSELDVAPMGYGDKGGVIV